MLVEKYVRIISPDKRYRLNPYAFAVSKSKASGLFVTGQQDILNEDKMTGKEKLSTYDKEKLCMGENPYIINPYSHYYCENGRKFNLSYDEDSKKKKTYISPKDYAEFTFFTLQPEVCFGKENFKKGKHYFYVEDKDREAEILIKQDDLIYDAEKLVREELTLGKYKDLVLMLNYEIPGFNVDPDNLTDIQLKARIIEASRKHPEAVMKFKEKNVDEILFVLKLLKYSFIERKNGLDYYNGGEYIGQSMESVRQYIAKPELQTQVSKWSKLIKKKENSAIEEPNE